MPEPAKAVQSAQDEPIAPTPQIPADKPATAEKTDKAVPSDKKLMDLLDIPPELQSRIAKQEEVKVEAEEPEQQPELPVQVPEKDEEPEELEPDEEKPEEVPAAAEQPPQKIDGRQKRINRLTRQKSELEEQLDRIAGENQRLREEMQRNQANLPENQPPALIGGELSRIEEKIRAADEVLTWCDRNSDGGEIGEGEKAEYIDSDAVRRWRRDNEAKRQELVVEKRDELKRLSFVRDQADKEAYEMCPAMFDRTKPEYQEAVAYVRTYPFLVAIPEANRALALLIEGRKSMESKSQARNGQVRKPKDIDERAFNTPRVPIAPHTPEPPSRESKPSQTKRYNEAMSNLVKDPDGGLERLTDAFSALEEARKSRVSSQSPVKS